MGVCLSVKGEEGGGEKVGAVLVIHCSCCDAPSPWARGD